MSNNHPKPGQQGWQKRSPRPTPKPQATPTNTLARANPLESFEQAKQQFLRDDAARRKAIPTLGSLVQVKHHNSRNRGIVGTVTWRGTRPTKNGRRERAWVRIQPPDPRDDDVYALESTLLIKVDGEWHNTQTEASCLHHAQQWKLKHPTPRSPQLAASR